MLKISLNSIINIVQGIVGHPYTFFKGNFSEKIKYNIFVLFVLSAFLTFIKSFTFNVEGNSINYYSNEIYNMLFSFLAIPQIKWLSTYLIFFVFLLLLYLFCHLYTKSCNKKELLLDYLAIGSIGVFLQILFLCLSFVLSNQIIFFISYIALIWIIYLSIIAVKSSQKMSGLKAVFVYISSALPIFLIGGIPCIAPNLMWLHLW